MVLEVPHLEEEEEEAQHLALVMILHLAAVVQDWLPLYVS